jgi:stalled ribosome rescue protein Dom34
MSGKNKKQFGVWLDSVHAVVVGREENEAGNFVVLAHEKSPVAEKGGNENVAHNTERGDLQKLFKNITSHMQNVEEIHVTGTGVTQEQFINYLSEIPQYKNAVAAESTSNKMSDEALVKYISEKFQ